MATFVLVHGSYLGPWSWNLIISSLNRKGHQAINIGLPASTEGLTANDYAQTIIDQIEGKQVKDEIVLVGHDLANLIMPIVQEKFSVRRLIYIAPLIPRAGYSINSDLENEQANMMLVDSCPDPVANRADAFRYWLHDCDPDIASWASSRFSKNTYVKLLDEVVPLKSNSGTSTSVIVCKNDRLINSSTMEQLSKELLDVEALSIDSGHCPQLSRPQELALLLMQLGNLKGK